MATEDKTDSRPDTSEKIILAARTEFADYGYDGARVDRIAVGAGVNKAMIYYHFNSKRNLYIEVIKSHFEVIKNFALKKVEPAETYEDVLRTAASTYAEMSERITSFKPIILRELANPNPEVLDEIVTAFKESGFKEKLAQSIVGGIENGQIRSLDMRQMIASFITMNIGYLFMAPLINRILGIDDQETFIQERKEAVVDIFLNGVRTR